MSWWVVLPQGLGGSYLRTSGRRRRLGPHGSPVAPQDAAPRGLLVAAPMAPSGAQFVSVRTRGVLFGPRVPCGPKAKLLAFGTPVFVLTGCFLCCCIHRCCCSFFILEFIRHYRLRATVILRCPSLSSSCVVVSSSPSRLSLSWCHHHLDHP